MFISVCKNVIAANNKGGWTNPQPAIRVSRTAGGSVHARGHTVAIKDSAGNTVARIVSTRDGKPVISCGAKVAIITEYPVGVDEDTPAPARERKPSDYCCMGAGCSNPEYCDEHGKPCGWPGTVEEWKKGIDDGE